MSTDNIIFVAHDVGGTGGMERHAEQLIERLLASGRRVTVVARTCRIKPRDGLRFQRIRTPRQPAAIAYPAFFAVASAVLARRNGALLHTTGAIVANRADVSTVHYCHRAAARRMQAPRASRGGYLYRINSAIASAYARAGEEWCYRPRRTRLLCGVSTGVAVELREGFPEMAEAIRSIPNGVDASVFRPDADTREAFRKELGLDDGTALALFVGGDWERKGLACAVGALADAPAWHLAVAGAGNIDPHLSLARAVGAESRLHFLGPVQDMPRVYAGADAFVLPTTYEAFPLVILEAAASGLPLLVTHVNGADELVDEGSNGWFITRDAKDIARRLNHLSADPDQARKMASQARAAASRYTWEAMADGYHALYSELADDR